MYTLIARQSNFRSIIAYDTTLDMCLYQLDVHAKEHNYTHLYSIHSLDKPRNYTYYNPNGEKITHRQFKTMLHILSP